MARKSKLTDEQLIECQRRHISGESIRALAREFGVSESALRERISAQSAQIKNVAKQIVDTERAISELPISAQITAHGLASRLRAISENLAGAAHYGAATAHRLAGIANAKVQEIDDAKPLDEQSLDALKGVAALTKMANEASTVGLNLLSANKEAVKQAITPPEDPQSQAPARPKISRDEWLKHHGMAG